jgi:hypothetical protein
VSQNVHCPPLLFTVKIDGVEQLPGNAQMDWTLIGFVVFKGLVFTTGMVFAIKWHYDREKKGLDRRALLRAVIKIAAIFLLLLGVLLLFTFGLARTLGMDLSLP